MHVTFDHRETVATGIKTFWFKPEHPIRFTAGQFTELYLEHIDADARGLRRWFTLSSSPTEPLLGVTTTFVGSGGSSFKKKMHTLTPGDELQLADPMGDFVLPKDPSIPLVFIAAGAGITPMRSMIKYLLDVQEQRHVHLIYAVTHADELAFLPLFRQYNLRLTTIVKKPTASYTGETGSLTPARILQLAGDNSKPYYYFSGPEPMVEAFYKDYTAKGIDPNRLVADYFPGYTTF
jgi:ferredoxin-NADP reductase